MGKVNVAIQDLKSDLESLKEARFAYAKDLKSDLESLKEARFAYAKDLKTKICH